MCLRKMGKRWNWIRAHLNYREWQWAKSTSHLQLDRELSPLKIFLEDYVKNPPDPKKVQIAKEAKSLADETEVKLATGDVQEAWALFYRAELLQYKLLGTEEIDARAGRILFEQIGMLNDGAKKHVRGLIGKDSGNGDWKLKQTPIKTEKVIEARRIIQEYYTDKYTNLELALKQLGVLATVAVLASLAIIYATVAVPSDSFAFDHLSAANFTATEVTATDFKATNFTATNFNATDLIASNASQVSSGHWIFWIAIGLFGAVGGAISGLYGIRQAYSLESGTPERVLNNWITLAKPAVGFAAAIIIATFLIGGLVQAANITISNYLVYSMAFISGFSERLIIGAVEERLPS